MFFYIVHKHRDKSLRVYIEQKNGHIDHLFPLGVL